MKRKEEKVLEVLRSKYRRLGGWAKRFMPYLLQLCMAGFAFIAAGAPMFGGLFPLGMAVAAGARDHYAIAATLGAVLGYMLSMDTLVGIQYSIAIATALFLRPILHKIANRVIVMATLPLTSSISLLLMRLFLPLVTDKQSDIFATLCEIMLVLLFSFMLSVFFSEMVRLDNFSDLSGEGKASLLFAFITLCISLLRFEILDFNLGIVVIALLTCLIGYGYGERICGVLAVSALVAFSIAEPTLIYSGVGIAIGGLFAGLLSHGEKFGIATLFFCCSVFGVVLAPNTSAAAIYILEIIVATGLFIPIPKAMLPLRFPKDPINPDARTAARQLSGRLKRFGEALVDINDVVNKVFVRSNVKKQSADSIAIDYTIDNCCKDCSGYNTCWNNFAQDTIDSMRQVLVAIATRGSVGPVWLTEIFDNRCNRSFELCSILHRAQAVAATERTGMLKSELMRSSLSEQFSAMGEALSKLSAEIYREEYVDRNKTAKLMAMFKELGLSPIEGAVVMERSEKMRLNISCCRVYLDENQRGSLTEEVGHLLGRQFFPCIMRDFETVTSFEFYEMAKFTVEFAASGKAADRSGINGDILKTFSDDHGNAHAILSDGMGKGKSAAVDASIAAVLSTKLLSAGFGTGEAARLVNVALSLKTNEESGATLDILSINLYSGEGTIYKAGAAPTFHVTKNAIHCIDPLTLPIGIMPGVTGTEVPIKFELYDMLVMVSDGTLGEGDTDWLPELIDRMYGKSSRELAAAIMQKAKELGDESDHRDDMSVIVLKMIPATTVHRQSERQEEREEFEPSLAESH